jgi:dTDP-glucose pyrophosphorylase
VNIVITAAGRGRRFTDAGYDRPKPLIDVLGEPMYAWAVRSLPLERADRLIFLALAEHLERLGLRADIESRFGGYNLEIVAVEAPTEGQAVTALLARRWIRDGVPLIIHNADTYFVSRLGHTLETGGPRDGTISVFEDSDPRWSFAAVDSSGRVTRVAEKEPISNLATTGMYHFARGRDFVSAAEWMVRHNLRVRGEFYIAPVYNRLISAGAVIGIDPASEVYCFGTPEDLGRSLERLRERTPRAVRTDGGVRRATGASVGT